jgi:uncharacterized protein HemX
MKRKHLVILIASACAAVVLFLAAALSIGGFSWYARVQEDNKQRSEAEAAQKAAAEAAAARLANVELNMEQASRQLEQAKATGQKNKTE